MNLESTIFCKRAQNGRLLLFAIVICKLLTDFGNAQTMFKPNVPPVTNIQLTKIKLTVVKGQLLARATTKQGKDWQFGQDIQTIVATRDQVFVLSTLGKLTALRVTDGQPKWSASTGLKTPVTTEMKLIVLDKTIIASARHPTGSIPSEGKLPTLAAFNTAKGIRLWGYSTAYSDGPCESGGIAAVYIGKVVWNFDCAGTYTYSMLRTFDLRSGKLLWEMQSGSSTDYGIADRGFLFVIWSFPGSLEWQVFKTNIQTGKFTTHKISIPLKARQSCGMIEPTWQRRFEDKSIFFSAEDLCGRFKRRFALW